MNYLRDNKIEKELDDLNWTVIESSKVNDKIIDKLIEYLKSDISENFFISLESVLKIGEKAKSKIKLALNDKKTLKDFNKNMLMFILGFYEKGFIEDPFILQLYHPDFIIRAKAIMQVEDSGDLKYNELISPLINDPDDSVRWAAIKLFESNNLIAVPNIRKKLQDRLKIEPNLIIQKRIRELLKG